MVFPLHVALALTLVALGLVPGAAHLLELPVKLGYPPALYVQVTGTLYRWYGIVGGTVQVAAALAVTLLAVRARHLPSAGYTAASAAALVVSLLLWGGLVAPVNAAWAQALRTGGEAVVVYEQFRLRWEYGHLAAFIAWLTGWLGLVIGITCHPTQASGGGIRGR